MTTCKICGSEFNKARPLQKVCSPLCAMNHVRNTEKKKHEKAIKLEKAQTREKLKALIKLPELKKLAQAAFNSYIRERDKDKPCISCGKPPSWNGQWHASHFKSVGANSFLRFHLWNVHKSCSICNNYLSGNLFEYSKNLPNRIGVDRFEYLLNAPIHRIHDRAYLIRLADIFRKKTKRLKNSIHL